MTDYDTVPWREAFPDLDDHQLPGVCLRGARVKEGISQDLLADLTGIRRHHISEMENHKRSIGKNAAKSFEKVLKVSYRVFFL